MLYQLSYVGAKAAAFLAPPGEGRKPTPQRAVATRATYRSGMIKKRRSSAKAAFGQQEAMIRRSARGKRFVGDDTGSAQARAAERAKVLRLQVAAHEAERRATERRAAEQAHEEVLRRPWWEAVGGLVLGSARLATSVAFLPFRVAKLPFRIAASLVPRLRTA